MAIFNGGTQKTEQTPQKSLRPIKLAPLSPEDVAKLFDQNKQRREIREQQDIEYRRQSLGIYYRHEAWMQSSTGEHFHVPPPFLRDSHQIDLLPTQKLEPQPKITNKLTEYRETSSDSYDMTVLRRARSLRLLIEEATQKYGRLPHAIRLHPFAAAVLALTDACSTNDNGSKYIFYAGVIPLQTDVLLSMTKLILKWDDPFLELPFDFFSL
jgi:hypothetical protein